MILLDANLLVYAHDETSPHHNRARGWLEDRLNEPHPVGIAWASIIAFIRLTTNPRVSASPSTPAEAWQHVDSWFSSSSAWVPQPTERHAEVLRGLVIDLGLTGNLVSDAHLAALAIEHGLTVCSADSDFARFPAIRWLNPLLTQVDSHALPDRPQLGDRSGGWLAGADERCGEPALTLVPVETADVADLAELDGKTDAYA